MSKTIDKSCIHVALKEFVERLIESQTKLFKTKLKYLDAARKIQAKEYARRLTELNHAHEANLLRNAEFIRFDKFESFEREFRMYKESNDKAVDSKAKALADAVDQKATAATLAVDQKASAIKKEFDDYKTSSATAVALAAGRKEVADPQMAEFIREMRQMQKTKETTEAESMGANRKMSALKTAVISAVGVTASFLWALSLAVGIYFAFHAAASKPTDDTELTRLRLQQTLLVEKLLHEKPTTTPAP